MPLELLDTSDNGLLDDAVEFPPLAVIYKHSPMCSISAKALVEVEMFARENPDVPVFMVDVLTQRSLSQSIAQKLGVHHESPQVIVLKDGKPSWHRSGSRVRLDAIEYAVDAAAG